MDNISAKRVTVIGGIVLGLLLATLAACSKDKPGSPPLPTPLVSPTTRPTLRPAPTLPVNLIATATPLLQFRPVARVTVNLNVRSGPSAEETKVGLLEADSEAEVTGQSRDGQWLRIVYPAAPTGEAWIAAEYVEVNRADIPIITDAAQTITATDLPDLAETGSPLTLTPLPIAVLTATTTLTPDPAATRPAYRLELSLDPETVQLPGCARLLVELQDIAGAALNGAPLAADHGRFAADICPPITTNYTLTGLGPDGRTITRSLRLTVLPSTPTPAADRAAIPISTTSGCQVALARLGTPNSALCRFAPDGRRIAAPAADGSLWIVEVDGSDLTRVAAFTGRFLVEGEVVWSPDGDALAFSTTTLDGSGSGVGVYRFSTGQLIYFGPDPNSGETDSAAWPRWTQDGRLLVTWYFQGPAEPGAVSVLAPARYAPDGPAVLPGGIELVLSTGYKGQQVHPWLPGKVWPVGSSAYYEDDF